MAEVRIRLWLKYSSLVFEIGRLDGSYEINWKKTNIIFKAMYFWMKPIAGQLI